MADRFNLLVKTFKQANPNLTHEKAQNGVKGYYQGDSKAYHNLKDSKIVKNWLETHVYKSKYCLQIEKCNNIECCQLMQSNVQEVLGGKFLPVPVALSFSLSWSISYQSM